MKVLVCLKQAPGIQHCFAPGIRSCGCLAGPTPTIDAPGHCLTFVPAVGAVQTCRATSSIDRLGDKDFKTNLAANQQIVGNL